MRLSFLGGGPDTKLCPVQRRNFHFNYVRSDLSTPTGSQGPAILAKPKRLPIRPGWLAGGSKPDPWTWLT